MKEKLDIGKIFADAAQVKIEGDTSDSISYREFVGFFKNISVIEKHHLVIGANFVYGWMQTTLNFKTRTFDSCVQSLQAAKRGDRLSVDKLGELKKLINNSLVGTSKLLHFVSPQRFAIWDSRVYRYINKCDDYEDLENPENYLKYLTACDEAVKHPNFPTTHCSINKRLGYDVSALRALELVMYLCGEKPPKSKNSKSRKP